MSINTEGRCKDNAHMNTENNKSKSETVYAFDYHHLHSNFIRRTEFVYKVEMTKR